MTSHLPKAAFVALAGMLTLGGCVDGIHVVDHTDSGTLTCPNMDPVAQKYMQGTPRDPVRCGPQKVNYWDPNVTTTGQITKPAG